MEYALFIVTLLLLGEWLLELTWSAPYYRRGIAVYETTTSAAVPTGIELHLAEPGFWWGLSHLVYRRSSFQQVLFRESAFTRWVGIHGRIVEQPDGRHRIVVYTALWPHLAWLGTGAALLSEGELVGAGVAVAVGAVWTFLQRMRSDEIRTAIERIA